ncbi:DUF1694 domain-containing protein [Tepidibacillus marianensis]|uniref:DUF1694 domain-containing protein n=1 Tax=Tepidibacillus marianensis TaxID=3131995 RepID=UPI0030D1081E
MPKDSKQSNLDDIQEIIEEETRSKFNQTSAVTKYLLDNQPISKNNTTTLGIDQDDILYSYTFDELNKPQTYEQIASHLSEERVKKIVMHSNITVEGIERIMKQAEKCDIPFTIVQSPEFKGNIGLELIR